VKTQGTHASSPASKSTSTDSPDTPEKTKTLDPAPQGRLIERWFAEIQRRCLDRGVFCSLEDLTTALQEWIKLWNDSARPFKWTKTPDQIIDAICRYCDRISRPAH
jgi:hypothetical protein